MNDNRRFNKEKNNRPERRPERRADRFAERPAPVEEVEGQIEGRNALTEALRAGRTIDKVLWQREIRTAPCSGWQRRPRRPVL